MKSNTAIRAKICALGSGFPDNIVTNKDLEKFVDTSDQWISERTGIRERRRLLDGENNSDIGAKAALAALESAGKTPADVDLIIGCTNTPDRWMPSMAAMVQAKIGATEKCAAYDVVTACAGWLAGMQIANAFIRSGQYENILVVGSEALTRFVNWKDRGTCVLFGDGAGAALVTRATASEKSEIIDMRVRSDGRYGDILDMPGAGSRMPTSQTVIDGGLQYIHMNGQEIFKHAVRNMTSICEEILEAHKLTINDIDWFIPHQANIRIIDAVGKKLGAPAEKVALNVHKYGNTSTATIPTCFDEYAEMGKIKRGDLVLMTSFGGGLTWAGGLVRW